MCDIKEEQSKWPTWQVRAHEQKKMPSEDRAKKRARGEIPKKKRRMRGKIERNQKKRTSRSECCAIPPKECPKMKNDARGKKLMDDYKL